MYYKFSCLRTEMLLHHLLNLSWNQFLRLMTIYQPMSLLKQLTLYIKGKPYIKYYLCKKDLEYGKLTLAPKTNSLGVCTSFSLVSNLCRLVTLTFYYKVFLNDSLMLRTSLLQQVLSISGQRL